VEHVFVGEALRTLWRRGVFHVEVLRSEFDAHGYDLVMVRRRTMRHIQFKTGTGGQAVETVGEWDLPLNRLLYQGFALYLNRRSLVPGRR